MPYRHFGLMLDCSRNGVLQVVEVKRMIDCLVKMGYDTLELYTEDVYEVEDEPYFGYMRGRYTAQEIQEIDAYAKEKGVELIPCIQTLAHFTNLVKLPHYRDIVDCGHILLIDEEKTYALIEKIFQFLAKNFTSRLVNIGMDEAHMVGLGKYLDKHGYQNRFDLLLRHLNRVVDIAEKYGFKAHIWSDMFFRLINNGGYYGRGLHIPDEVVAKMPKNVELAFWNYYTWEKETYDAMFLSHVETGKNVWFAGGAWSWTGFAPINSYTQKTMIPAIESAREYGIQDVLITMWSDSGKECSFYALLPSLYLIRRHADGVTDEAQIKKEFFDIFNVSYDDFMLLDLPNVTPKSQEWEHVHVPSRIVFFSDCFMNSSDAYLTEETRIDYGECARKIEEALPRSGEFRYIFQTVASFCRALEIKGDLSLRTRARYKAKDKEALTELLKDYERLIPRIETFFSDFATLWERENKALGFEIHDVRFGGLMQRVKRCRERLARYISGEIEKIEELEADILPYTPLPYSPVAYRNLISTSEI